MGREVSHGQEACGSISAHQASNYDLLHLPPGSGIHIKNNLNCRVCFGLFRICQVKEGTLYKNKLQKIELILSFQVWIQADPASLAVSHVSWEDGKFPYTCPQEGQTVYQNVG